MNKQKSRKYQPPLDFPLCHALMAVVEREIAQALWPQGQTIESGKKDPPNCK